MDLGSIGNVVKTDLLVISGGVGGLYAAIKAKQAGVENVLIVDKGAVSLTNQFQFGGWYTIFLLPGDDPDEWLKGFIAGQQGMCPQDKIGKLLDESAARLRELEGMGLTYPRDVETGRYRRIPSRGLGPVKTLCPPNYKTHIGGPAVTAVLCRQARRLKVEFFEKTFVSDLIVADGRVQGAVGRHRRTGEFHIFQARAVVVAGGDCSFRGNYAAVEQTTGDAFAIAYRAGVDLTNMEFLVCNTGPVDFSLRGTGPLAKLGAVFRNSAGEDFLRDYHPDGSGADCSCIVQGMAAEVKRHHGPPFYFDMTPTPAETESQFLSEGGWMARNLIRLKERNISVFDRRVEWVPVIQTLRGGLHTDANCMTNVAGLFAAGTANSTGPGLFTGWSSAKCMWSGATAGRCAANFINGGEAPTPDADQIHRLRSRLFNRTIGSNTSDTTVNAVTRNLQEALFSYDVSILKHEDRLLQTKENLRAIRENDLSRAGVPNLHDFVRFKETENMFLVADLFLNASILRRESRADHRREDYPERADWQWLKWIVHNKNLESGYRFEEFPWSKYKYGLAELASAGETAA